MDGENNDIIFYVCVPREHSLAYVNKPKMFITDNVHYMARTINIHMQRKAY